PLLLLVQGLLARLPGRPRRLGAVALDAGVELLAHAAPPRQRAPLLRRGAACGLGPRGGAPAAARRESRGRAVPADRGPARPRGGWPYTWPVITNARRNTSMQLRTRYWILTVVTAAGLTAADSAEPAKVMMEAARKKEVVDGDLSAAIKQYGAIAARYAKSDR